MSDLNLVWINRAPIRKVNNDGAARAIQQITDNMDGWDPVAIPDPVDPSDINQRDWKTPKRTQQECWNERIDATHRMLSTSFIGDCYVYEIGGQAIAVMAMTSNLIADLVTHPGSETAGGIMVEFAANYSQTIAKANLMKSITHQIWKS